MDGMRVRRLEFHPVVATSYAIGAHQTVKLNVRLRAKYPIHPKSFASRVYEYYDPTITGTAMPVRFEVIAR